MERGRSYAADVYQTLDPEIHELDADEPGDERWNSILKCQLRASTVTDRGQHVWDPRDGYPRGVPRVLVEAIHAAWDRRNEDDETPAPLFEDGTIVDDIADIRDNLDAVEPGDSSV
jgi:hypothetical protein